MARSRKRTQKQAALKYKGNLDYFRKPHAFRTLRLACFVLAVVGSLAAVLGFRYYGGKKQLTFSCTGPLSFKHARFADRCEVCHENAQPDLLQALKFDDAAKHLDGLKNVTGEDVKANAEWVRASLRRVQLAPQRLRQDAAEIARKSASLARLDQACIRCHAPQSLHQPQAVALKLRKVYGQVAIVHANSCSSCHREHQGPEPMKEPPANNCVSCHGNKAQLLADFKLVPPRGKTLPQTGIIDDQLLGDGVRQFFPPRPASYQPVVFKSFADGHPDFGYEQPGARDFAKIKYNHQRHERADVVLDGRKLDCADCHKPGEGGIYMQPIRYQDHCARCHSLQLDPELSDLLIPHRDADKVYAWLGSKSSQYLEYFTKHNPGVTDFAAKRDFVEKHLYSLMDHFKSDRALELAVFLNGDPPISDRLMGKSNTAQSLPSCKKCHEGVQETPDLSHNLQGWSQDQHGMERWLLRGLIYACAATWVHIVRIDCHAQALGEHENHRHSPACEEELHAMPSPSTTPRRKPPRTQPNRGGDQDWRRSRCLNSATMAESPPIASRATPAIAHRDADHRVHERQRFEVSAASLISRILRLRDHENTGNHPAGAVARHRFRFRTL